MAHTRWLVVSLCLALLIAASPLDAQKVCKKGKPCGNSCIAQDKVCRIAPAPDRPTPEKVPAPAESPGNTPPSDMQFIASSRGKVYYWKGCNAWQSLSPSNRVYFRTQQEAEGAGYRPSGQTGCAGPAGEVATDSLSANGDKCTVVRITDGDTLACGSVTVRLLLVDAPEMNQQPWGQKAAEALEVLVPVGSDVRLEYDVQERDRYGRVLAYVYGADGTLVNAALARRGYAVPLVIPPNVKRVDAIRAASDSARSAKEGLWATEAFLCLPADARAGRCR